MAISLMFFITCSMFVSGLSFSIGLPRDDPPLTLDYYSSSCPNAFEIIKKEIECAVLEDPRNAAVILRLHFHDCFVQGCDGSVLLDDTVTLQGEKTASKNANSLKGFKIVDKIKNKLESECPGVVSCADLLTVAARDAVLLVGGPYWHVPVGRKDSKTASYDQVATNLPAPEEGLLGIISKFLSQGLSVTDMVALAGAHTIGKARCRSFLSRIYTGDIEVTSALNPLSETYASHLRSICPVTAVTTSNTADEGVAAMDNITPELFDNSFYHTLLRGEGLLNSDQEMFSSVFAIQTRRLVSNFAADPAAFFEQFSVSMVKLGNITDPESFTDGEIRRNCRFINT